jgi:hypothetical protein
MPVSNKINRILIVVLTLTALLAVSAFFAIMTFDLFQSATSDSNEPNVDELLMINDPSAEETLPHNGELTLNITEQTTYQQGEDYIDGAFELLQVNVKTQVVYNQLTGIVYAIWQK